MLTSAQKANQLFDGITGDFEVFSVVSNLALTTEKMTFSQAFDKMESLAYGAGGVDNGLDIRRVQ